MVPKDLGRNGLIRVVIRSCGITVACSTKDRISITSWIQTYTRISMIDIPDPDCVILSVVY